jgi:aminobenzoyl-glutamate transport protein
MTAENDAPDAAENEAEKQNFVNRMLGGIEKVGNLVPHPAIIFLGLCALVIVLSQLFYWMDVSVTYDVVSPPPVTVETTDLTGSTAPEVIVTPNYQEEYQLQVEQQTTAIRGLLTVDGIRFLFTSFVPNFAGFNVVAVTFVAMMGVGVAEGAGLMAALIRKLVGAAPAGLLTFIIVFVGVLSSVATDAGYLILIPLGAAAFLSVGRHPLVGLAAAYAGVSVSFAVNALITPLDSLLTEITNEAIALTGSTETITITSNLYFSIASAIFTAIVVTVVTHRVIEPRLGPYQGRPAASPISGEDQVMTAGTDEISAHDADAGSSAEAKGLRNAVFGLLGVVIVIALFTLPPGAPLRDPETDEIVGNTPFMGSLVFLISLIFLVAGIAYGFGARTFSSSVDVINSIVKTFAGLAGLIFLLLIISQFIAYFNYSNMPTIAAVKMADVLEQLDVGALWLLIGLILVIAVLDIIITGALPKWAIFAPVFIPLFMRLGVAPQTVLAAYRIGDSPMNVITPMMVYLPFIVLTAQRYQQGAGLGTIIALMIPYTIIVLIAWLIFFVIWYLLGIPLGPGYPVQI